MATFFSLRDGILRILDESGTNSLVIALEDGNVGIGVPLDELVAATHRGVFRDPPDVRKGQEQPCTISFEAKALIDTFNDAAAGKLGDVLWQTGFVSSDWDSTVEATSDAILWTVQFDLVTGIPGVTDKRIELPYCSLRGDFSEGDMSSFSATGTSYKAKPTITNI